MKSNNHLSIAVDGESGSGKSYASKIIGKKYKCYILNSGLAYRYASYLIIKNKPKKIIPFLKKKIKKLNFLCVSKGVYWPLGYDLASSLSIFSPEINIFENLKKYFSKFIFWDIYFLFSGIFKDK